jgi:catechol 2,3-dioxygenase-like lactoylglutathione lyase family enzyme
MRIRTVYFKVPQIERASGSGSGRPGCVPVFEFTDSEVEARIARAKELGAKVVLEGEAHPDHPNPAAVLVDPFGNEFEFTCLHD